MTEHAASPIQEAIRTELAQPVAAPVRAVAEQIQRRHGAALVACLFYGSCLRDGVVEGRVLDFYAVAADYRAFHGGRLSAAMNTLLPPNVYYVEVPFEDTVVRAKYAVVSLAHLVRDTSAAAFQPTLWARLAQPCALVYARDAETEAVVVAALSAANETLACEILPLMPRRFTPKALWARAFAETYRTELRSERAGRPLTLYEAFAARYDRLALEMLAGSDGPARRDEARDDGHDTASPGLAHDARAGARRAAQFRWWIRRMIGRVLHVLRLVKAAYTFTGGLDYILWKIETHSGIKTEPSAWQRRHPLMAAPGLAWRLFRRGAFR